MLAALLLMAPVLTVDQVVARHGELNGQVVEVQGLLPKCAGYDCALWTKSEPGEPYWNGRRLGIAYSAHFDRFAASFVGRLVLLTARLDDRCLRGDIVCLDRSNTLWPIGDHPLRFQRSH